MSNIIKRSAGTVVVALMLSGCADGGDVSGPSRPMAGLVPAGVVQTAVQRLAPGTDGSVTFVVRVLAKDVGFSAYQGAVTFDPDAFELVSASAPGAGDDATRVLNTADFAAGRIRFAAFTTSVFTGADQGDGLEAFRFTVRALRPIASSPVDASLDVVGLESGTSVAKDRILASKGVYDAHGLVIR